MKMPNFFSRKSPKGPVVARKDKFGSVQLRCGERMFFFDPRGLCRIAVEQTGASWSIMGYKQGGIEPFALASFEDERDAKASFKALASVMFGGSWGFLKWLIVIVLAWIVLSTLIGGSFAGAMTSSDQVGSAPQAGQHLASAGPNSPAGASWYPGKFDSDEPSLDDLASGGYRPNINVKAPDVSVEPLNCAPAN